MNATNPPLEQWQIDHIRKMQQELGLPQMAPGAEEVSMDEDLETGADTETAMPVGALSYADAQYADAQKQADLANTDVTGQINANINLLLNAQNKLRERRVGPSDSEKWLAIAAALGQPTRTGAFGESLGNVAKTLGEQRSARREAEEKRDLMLEKYGLDVGTERLRLLQARATQANQMLRAAIAANKPADPFKGAVYDPVSQRWVLRPGTAGGPPVLSMDEAAKLAQNPANRGMRFYTQDGQLREIE